MTRGWGSRDKVERLGSQSAGIGNAMLFMILSLVLRTTGDFEAWK